MNPLFKVLFSRILILMIAISSAQGAVATSDFNQNMHGEEHQMIQISSLVETGAFVDNVNRPAGQDQGKQVHSQCEMQCYMPALRVPQEAFLFVRSLSQQKIYSDSRSFTSHLSGLPKRPPKG